MVHFKITLVSIQRKVAGKLYLLEKLEYVIFGISMDWLLSTPKFGIFIL